MCLAVATPVFIHVCLVGWGAYIHSPNLDEVGHLPAGVSHWEFWEFDLYRVNPPLVRVVAGLPVYLMGLDFDWRFYGEAPGARGEYAVGQRFIRRYGPRSEWYFTIARWACLPFTIIGALGVFFWSRELFGFAGGFVSLLLWCFSPNVIAHAQTIVPDAGAAAMGVVACYVYWRWMKRPSWTRASVAGVFLGLALLTKTTLLILFVIYVAGWAVYLRSHRRGNSWHTLRRQAGQLAVVFTIGLYVLNLGYVFEGSFARLDSYTFVSSTLSGAEGNVTEFGNRFAGHWIGFVPVPLPENYVQGIDYQKREFEKGRASYLRGKWKHGGWWYYYLYGLLIKVPLGTWLLFGLSTVIAVVGRPCGVRRHDAWFVLLPAAGVLVLVSSQTGFNHHLRYVLPAFPFMFVWAGLSARLLLVWRPLPSLAVAGCLIWSLASSVSVYPHSLSYFNELVGGPDHGHEHLLHSNIDWGQDMSLLRRWMQRHPQAVPLGLADIHSVNANYMGIDYATVNTWPPRQSDAELPAEQIGPQPGWFIISVNYLHGNSTRSWWGRPSYEYAQDPSYGYFNRFERVGQIGYSAYIYHVTPDEANRVRKELGLPELSPDDSLTRDGNLR